MDGKIIKTSIRLPVDVYHALKAEAEQDSRTMHSLMVKILRDHVTNTKGKPE